VDFSLKRGTSEDPKAPPLACVSILDPNVHLPAQPKAERGKADSVLSIEKKNKKAVLCERQPFLHTIR
jgi:hypothetical protein